MARRSLCPCGSQVAYRDCCGVFHAGVATAPTALALMRSRYAAFVVGDVDYLRATWHPATCPDDLAPDPDVRWTGLEILAVTGGGADDEKGTVEFRAHHATTGPDAGVRAEVLHETSRFSRHDGRWVYVRGRFHPRATPGATTGGA